MAFCNRSLLALLFTLVLLSCGALCSESLPAQVADQNSGAGETVNETEAQLGDGDDAANADAQGESDSELLKTGGTWHFGSENEDKKKSNTSTNDTDRPREGASTTNMEGVVVGSALIFAASYLFNH